MRLRHVIAVVVGLAALGWGVRSLLAQHATAADTVAAPPPLVPVTATTAAPRDMPVFDTGLGTVQAINTVNVKTRVDGEIMRAYFTQGQEVQQGDRLFLIDPRPYQATLDQAVANQQKDAAQLAGAQRDLERYGKLVGSGYQTRQSFEDQQATVAQLQAAIQADKAAIEQARLNLEYTSITAPLTGRTGARLVDPGNYVQTGTGTPLVSITQLQPIFVSFTLPAKDLDAIRQGQAAHPLEVEAFATGDGRLIARGTLDFIDNHIDDSTGTIALKGRFANSDEALWPGEFVDVRLVLSVRKNAVTVPAETVMAGPNGDYVYVIRPDETVLRRGVEVASRQDGMAVIATGLAAGERVVLAGQYRLANNVKVRVENAPATAMKQAG